MGGSSKSATTVATTQTDRRIGATDQAKVLTGGSTLREDTRTNITVRNTDAEVIKAALAGTKGLTSEALEFSTRQAEQGARLVETALAGTQQDLAGFQQLNKTVLYLGVAAVAVFAFAGRR